MSLGRMMAALALTWGLAADAATAAPPAEGRAFYHGLVPFRPGVTTLPAPFSACARCHGGSGEGGREGAFQAPALTWAALTAPRDGVPAFDGETAVLRAIRDGVGRAGTVLATAMPRYKFDAEDAAALLAYLHQLATPDDLPTGVGRNRIELATLLPLSGAAGATGRAVLAGLGDSLSASNRDGGVFGRHLELRVFDTANGVEAAARSLRMEAVFAIVGGLWTERGAVDAALADHHVSVVAPLSPRDAPAPNDQSVVGLLPTRMAQEKALAAALLACPAETRWSLRVSDADTPAAPGPIRWFADPDQLRSALRAAPEGGCLGLDLATAAVLQSDIPVAWRQRIVLPVPSKLLGRAEPWRILGRAAGELAIELLSRAGAQLHERSLVEAAARLDGFEPQGLAPVHARAGHFEGWDAEAVDVSTSAHPATQDTASQKGD